jgi:hypothetical protein
MFQRLTEEIGDPNLREHLASVVAVMKGAADDWAGFTKMIDRALPKYKPMPLFDNVPEWKTTTCKLFLPEAATKSATQC